MVKVPNTPPQCVVDELHASIPSSIEDTSRDTCIGRSELLSYDSLRRAESVRTTPPTRHRSVGPLAWSLQSRTRRNDDTEGHVSIVAAASFANPHVDFESINDDDVQRLVTDVAPRRAVRTRRARRNRDPNASVRDSQSLRACHCPSSELSDPFRGARRLCKTCRHERRGVPVDEPRRKSVRSPVARLKGSPNGEPGSAQNRVSKDAP